MDAVVIVGEGGLVERIEAWPWEGGPNVGTPLFDAFEPADAAVLRQYAEREWVHVAEGLFVLRSGPTVRLCVAPDGRRVFLFDWTTLAELERLGEERRRTTALAQLSLALARELSDPLSVVLSRLELALQTDPADLATLTRDLTIAFEHTRRATATLHNLRTVGRFPGPSLEPTRLRAAIDAALSLLGARARYVEVRLDQDDLEVACQPELVTHVCTSILRRLLDTVGPVAVHLAAKRVRVGTVSLQLGPARRTSWEPVRIVEEASFDQTLLASVGGTLTTGRTATGLQVLVTLPQPIPTRANPKKVGQTVLVVGSRVGPHLSELLAREGYTVVGARSADEALARYPEADVAFVELLLDDTFSGRHVAEVMLRRAAKRVVLVADGAGPAAAVPAGAVGLRWPASLDEVAAALGGGRQRSPPPGGLRRR